MSTLRQLQAAVGEFFAAKEQDRDTALADLIAIYDALPKPRPPRKKASAEKDQVAA